MVTCVIIAPSRIVKDFQIGPLCSKFQGRELRNLQATVAFLLSLLTAEEKGTQKLQKSSEFALQKRGREGSSTKNYLRS